MTCITLLLIILSLCILAKNLPSNSGLFSTWSSFISQNQATSSVSLTPKVSCNSAVRPKATTVVIVWSVSLSLATLTHLEYLTVAPIIPFNLTQPTPSNLRSRESSSLSWITITSSSCIEPRTFAFWSSGSSATILLVVLTKSGASFFISNILYLASSSTTFSFPCSFLSIIYVSSSSLFLSAELNDNHILPSSA